MRKWLTAQIKKLEAPICHDRKRFSGEQFQILSLQDWVEKLSLIPLNRNTATEFGFDPGKLEHPPPKPFYKKADEWGNNSVLNIDVDH
jgi:hypothetical protein